MYIGMALLQRNVKREELFARFVPTVYICICLYTCVCIYAYMHIYIYFKYMYVYIYKYTYMYLYCIHMYIHIHSYIGRASCQAGLRARKYICGQGHSPTICRGYERSKCSPPTRRSERPFNCS
jgi:hypothetical protein